MAAGAMTTFRQLGQALGVAAFGVLFQHGGAAMVDGLNRVLLTAAGTGILGAVLAYVFVPEPTRTSAVSPMPTGGPATRA